LTTAKEAPKDLKGLSYEQAAENHSTGRGLKTTALTNCNIKLKTHNDFRSSVFPQAHTDVNFIEEYFHLICMNVKRMRTNSNRTFEA
jgi:hypothetical protein